MPVAATFTSSASSHWCRGCWRWMRAPQRCARWRRAWRWASPSSRPRSAGSASPSASSPDSARSAVGWCCCWRRPCCSRSCWRSRWSAISPGNGMARRSAPWPAPAPGRAANGCCRNCSATPSATGCIRHCRCASWPTSAVRPASASCCCWSTKASSSRSASIATARADGRDRASPSPRSCSHGSVTVAGAQPRSQRMRTQASRCGWRWCRPISSTTNACAASAVRTRWCARCWTPISRCRARRSNRDTPTQCCGRRPCIRRRTAMRRARTARCWIVRSRTSSRRSARRWYSAATTSTPTASTTPPRSSRRMAARWGCTGRAIRSR